MGRLENLQNFKNGFDKVRIALQTCPKQVFDFKPSPEKWSIREIILHLADSEANAYVRCRKIIAEPFSEIMVYDQDKWAEELLYKEMDIDIALDLFALLRIATFELLKKIPDEKWINYMIHSVRGKVTLEEWLEIYSDHVDVHINQMIRNLNEWNTEKK